MDVWLLVTCLTDAFYPRAGRAVVAVLEHLGCRVHFPEGQTCCGQPMYNSGDHADAADLARRMIDVLEEACVVVTPSGSCCAMIRDYYNALLGDDPTYADRCAAFVNKTYEFVEFLHKELRVDLRDRGCRWGDGRAVPTTYHYSCHLRGLGMYDEATQLLRQVDGVDYIPLDRMDECCGFGGTFAVRWADVSSAMVDDKVDAIRRSGAEMLVSNDAGCTMNITGALHRAGVNVRTLHIAELIAEGFDLDIDS